MITKNLNQVKENIIKACERVGRDPSEVTLLAVSKKKSKEDIMEAYNVGHRIFAENYVQELTEKIDDLPSDIEWHMIGHLQRNKVKYVAGKVAMIHSVDSLRLANEINEFSLKKGFVTEILAEVNVGEEQNKFGFAPEEVEEFAVQVSEMSGIRLTGLMTSAPYVTNPEENRLIFRKLHDLCVDINKKSIDNVIMKKLSMGMTADYVVAVEEGATHVRVGTAIFGTRS